MSAPTSEVLYTTNPTISEGWYDGRKAGVIRLTASLAAAITGTLPIALPANAQIKATRICSTVAGTHATATGRVGVFFNATVSAANQLALSPAASGGVIAKNSQQATYVFGSSIVPSTSTTTLSLMSTDNAGTAAGGNVTGTFAIEIHYEVFSPIVDFV
jgi:hypothetical protein